jgi:uncharacterized protein (TIGR00290 family)
VRRVLLSWSSGKDSAWALHLLRLQGVDVAGLLTTINQEADRVAMHAVRRTLLEAQAAAAGLPLWTVPLPWPCSNERYEALMQEACGRATAAGIDAVAFGDLFLRDIREYRERNLRGTPIEPLFPLWEMPTEELARDIIAGGLKARITCVDKQALGTEFLGREFDAALLRDLPAGVDPCAENGEFHTFAYDGPMFAGPIAVAAGEVREEERFAFIDLLSGSEAGSRSHAATSLHQL